MFRESDSAPFGFKHDYIASFGSYSAGSAGVPNAFLNKLYTGGHIDADQKMTALKRMNDYNPFGIYAEAGVSWSWKTRIAIGSYSSQETSLKERIYKHGFMYRERALIYGGFQRDAFQLIFEGNRSFLSTSADFGRTRITNLRWQELKYALNIENPEKSVVWGFSIAVLNGQNFAKISIQQGNLFTDALGTALDAQLNGSWSVSDTAKSDWGSTNGLGTSIGFNITAYLDDAIYIKAGISDIGFIRWNKFTSTRSQDTTFCYTGIDLASQLFDITTANDLPTTNQLIGIPEKKSITTNIPAVFHFDMQTYDRDFVWGWSARGWIGNRVALYNLLWAGYANKRIKLRTGISFGGYARFQLPLDLALQLGQFQVRGGIQNMLAYTNPKTSTGQGAWIGLGYQFGGE
jgi:hypothetical protein